MKIERTKNATRNIVFGVILKAYQIIVNITVQMYPFSEGTDTGSPALRYRESGTGIPHFVTCEFTRLLPDPSRILHAWICNSPGPSG